MDVFMLAAKPWAYWISPMLAVISVLAVIGVVIGYVFKVVAAKYPKT
jgi:nitrate/TMAO reductase-like tetraheme cytochrome c subunit